MSEHTLKELETQVADAQKQLAAKKSAIAAGKELPQPPRDLSIVVDELLHRLVEHVGSPPKLDVLLREFDAGKPAETSPPPTDALKS